MAPRRTRSSAVAPPQLSSPPPTPAPASKRKTKKAEASPTIKNEEEVTEPPSTPAPAQPKSRKRARASAVEETKVLDELPHNLGALPTPGADDEPPTKKHASRSKKAKTNTDTQELTKIAANSGLIEDAPEKDTKAKKEKKVKYGLSPGETPYPDWPHPTPEECHEVVRLLSKVHGKVQAPKDIKPPSLDVAGCGEVPSVLDALIRTRLSAATTGTNSSRAFQGLVKTFGTISEGIGKGSVDWNKVRLAPQSEVFEAIKCGGLANAKSKDIKEILESVYGENQARSAELKGANGGAGPAGSEKEPASEKNDEISRAENAVLSLDHLHLLSSEEAFNKMVKYPGIGPKTASCVLLFCLQRPSFAVDTHVFRLCKYLGWVPSTNKKGEPPVGRNTTYSHCEVRVPDELKYPLHQLLIKHGKNCPRCRAATGISSEKWEEGCPIDHLVTRHGAKKGGSATSKKKGTTKASKKRKNVDAEDEDSEDSDLSEAGSDYEDE